MNNPINSARFWVLTLIVVLAAATRALPLLIPHIWNFTAVGALAVFAGAQFKDMRLAFGMPLAAMAMSDLFIGNGFIPAVYIGFVLMVLCGFMIRNKVSARNVSLASVLSAIVFYLVTNFSFLYPATLYPRNMQGVITSYVAAIPFLNNMLIGNLVFGLVFFGGFYILEKKYPRLAVK